MDLLKKQLEPLYDLWSTLEKKLNTMHYKQRLKVFLVGFVIVWALVSVLLTMPLGQKIKKIQKKVDTAEKMIKTKKAALEKIEKKEKEKTASQAALNAIKKEVANLELAVSAYEKASHPAASMHAVLQTISRQNAGVKIESVTPKVEYAFQLITIKAEASYQSAYRFLKQLVLKQSVLYVTDFHYTVSQWPMAQFELVIAIPKEPS